MVGFIRQINIYLSSTVSKEKINEKIKLVVCEGEGEDNRWFHSYSNPLRPTLPSHCPANLIFVFFTTYWICGVLVGIFLYWDGILGVFSIWGGLFWIMYLVISSQKYENYLHVSVTQNYKQILSFFFCHSPRVPNLTLSLPLFALQKTVFFASCTGGNKYQLCALDLSIDR